jgi:hypothetical protein
LSADDPASFAINSEACSVREDDETTDDTGDEDVDDGAEEDYLGDRSGRVSDFDSSSFKNMDDDARSVISNLTDDLDTTLGSMDNTSLPDLLGKHGLDYDGLFAPKVVKNDNGETITHHAPLIPSLFSNVAPVIRFITVHEKSVF